MIGRSVNFNLKLTKCASEDVKKKLASEPQTKDSYPFPFLENFNRICAGNTSYPDEQRVIFMSNEKMERVVFDSGKVEDRTYNTPFKSSSFTVSFKWFSKNFNELRKLVGKK